MTADLRDAEFVAAVGRERPMLQSTAYLLLDDPRSARELLDGVLARLYELRVPAASLQIATLRGLVGGDARLTTRPRATARRFELVDGQPRPITSPIVDDLARLPRDQRIVAVLTHLTQLDAEQIAAVLNRSPGEVAELTRQAQAELELGQPRRVSAQVLTQELHAAVPPELRLAGTGFDDLRRGRRLSSQRRLRRGLSAAAALLVLVVGASQLWPDPASVPSSSPPISKLPSSPIPTSQAGCDTNDSVCRATILRDWRSEMAGVTEEYVDPGGSYFSGYSFSYDDRYESPQIWEGGGGVMGFELFRLQSGGTQVYLQIATSRRTAVRCGTTTGTSCVSQRFMDGNRFILSETSDVAEGLEVQYSPMGDQVITVIARNVTQGRELPITRSDLITLVQDPRLRLPNL